MRHYATPTNLMHGIDYQTLNNPYLFRAWKILSDTKQSLLVLCLEQIIKHYATPANVMPGID